VEVAYVRDAQLADVLVLSKTMRKADREEIMASNGVSALEALVTPFTVNGAMNFSIIGTGDEGVVGMFGCCPSVDPQYGCAWLLQSDKLLTHRKQFLKECPYWVSKMGAGYDYLYNFVDKRNWVSLKWLQFLGFEPKEEFEEYGHGKIPFLLMIKEMKK
tara:strand:+ start:1404 stop:1880 length:477 start_codon:yes stop_codon:yes gene_type:complete